MPTAGAWIDEAYSNIDITDLDSQGRATGARLGSAKPSSAPSIEPDLGRRPGRGIRPLGRWVPRPARGRHGLAAISGRRQRRKSRRPTDRAEPCAPRAARTTPSRATPPACAATRLVRSSAAAAHAYSVPRIAKPIATTRIPGPGSTSIARPARTKAPPTAPTAIRLELRPMNRMISAGRAAIAQLYGHTDCLLRPRSRRSARGAQKGGDGHVLQASDGVEAGPRSRDHAEISGSLPCIGFSLSVWYAPIRSL